MCRDYNSRVLTYIAYVFSVLCFRIELKKSFIYTGSPFSTESFVSSIRLSTIAITSFLLILVSNTIMVFTIYALITSY